MEHFYHSIGGWGTYKDQGELIKYIISNYSKEDKLKIAEIGVYLGKTTAIWNVELINSGLEYDYIAIDNFLGSKEHRDGNSIPDYQLCLNNLVPIKDKINLLKSDSIEASKLYEDNCFDIVYIDASHEYEDVKKDIEAWYPKVKTGGFICGDDYIQGWSGVIKAVNKTIKQTITIIGNQQWIAKK